jgi:hypothetical protein
MTRPDADPPDHVPTEVAEALEASDDRQLREIVHYAQRLLREQRPVTDAAEHRSVADAIEPREGEELVRVDDHGGYASVVVERPDQTGEARGPFAYRVQWEPDVDGEGGSYYWHYLGRVAGAEGGE